MLTIDADTLDTTGAVNELLDGSGAVRLPRLFPEAQVNEARDLIIRYTDSQPETVSHFDQEGEDPTLQRRVWNLLNKGEVFVEMAQHPAVMAILGEFLGADFVMGSICASRIMPGYQGQEPHIDYPYWDFYRQESFPTRINASFPMNAQATIIIDPFTEEAGATAYLPGTQKTLEYPGEDSGFFDSCERMLGDPGDVVIFYGAVWHCAMPNTTDQGRIGILIEYLPKFIKPVEDLMTGLDQDFLGRASPMLRQLLGLDYPFPELFDT